MSQVDRDDLISTLFFTGLRVTGGIESEEGAVTLIIVIGPAASLIDC